MDRALRTVDNSFLLIVVATALATLALWASEPTPENQTFWDANPQFEYGRIGGETYDEASERYFAAYVPVAEGWKSKDARAGWATLSVSLILLFLMFRCRRFSDLGRLPALPWGWLHPPLFVAVWTALPFAIFQVIYRDYKRGANPPWADTLAIPAFTLFGSAVVIGVMLFLLVVLLTLAMREHTDTKLWHWRNFDQAQQWLGVALTAPFVAAPIWLICGAVQDGAVFVIPVALLLIYFALSVRAAFFEAMTG